MSLWTDVMRTLQQASLVHDKADRALKLGEEARQHSIENRERIIRLESIVDVAISRAAQKRLPEG